MDGKQHVLRGIRDDEGTASSHMTAYLLRKSESVTVIQESESEAVSAVLRVSFFLRHPLTFPESESRFERRESRVANKENPLFPSSPSGLVIRRQLFHVVARHEAWIHVNSYGLIDEGKG